VIADNRNIAFSTFKLYIPNHAKQRWRKQSLRKRTSLGRPTADAINSLTFVRLPKPRLGLGLPCLPSETVDLLLGRATAGLPFTMVLPCQFANQIEDNGSNNN